MTCDEALGLLYDYIDKEASEIDAKEMQEHLDGCRHCFKIHRLETSIQEFIAEKIRSDGSTPQLSHLKDKILVRLDNIDAEKSPGQPHRAYGIIAKIMVAAASVVILIGAASIASDYYSHYKYYMPLESAHFAVEEGTWDQPTFDVPPTSHLGMDFSGLGESSGFELVNSAMERISDIDMAHFVYRSDESIVSVFAVLDAEYDIPEDIAESPVIRDGIRFYDHHCRGCRVLFHQLGAAIIIVATTDHDLDIFPFTPVESVVLSRSRI